MRYPIAVLPSHSVGLDALKLDIYLAMELVVAQGWSVATAGPEDELTGLCADVASERGVSVTMPLAIHARALRRYERESAGLA